jgi:hypothetical protein
VPAFSRSGCWRSAGSDRIQPGGDVQNVRLDVRPVAIGQTEASIRTAEPQVCAGAVPAFSRFVFAFFWMARPGCRVDHASGTMLRPPAWPKPRSASARGHGRGFGRLFHSVRRRFRSSLVASRPCLRHHASVARVDHASGTMPQAPCFGTMRTCARASKKSTTRLPSCSSR